MRTAPARAFLVAASLTLLSVASAEDVMAPQAMPEALNREAASRPSSALEAEITALLSRYAEAYSRQDYAAVLGFWDRDDPDVFYIAEEIDPPMRGWKLIDAYFARPGVVDGIRYEYDKVRADLLAPDLAIATYNMRFDLKVKNMNPMAGFDRVVAVFRRRNGEWKFARYVEAPQAPMTMVRKFGRTAKTVTPERQKEVLKTIQTMQEEAVPADFADWLEAQADQARAPASGQRQ